MDILHLLQRHQNRDGAFLQNVDLCGAWRFGREPNPARLVHLRRLAVRERESAVARHKLAVNAVLGSGTHERHDGRPRTHGPRAAEVKNHVGRVLADVDGIPVGQLSAGQQHRVLLCFFHRLDKP